MTNTQTHSFPFGSVCINQGVLQYEGGSTIHVSGLDFEVDWSVSRGTFTAEKVTHYGKGCFKNLLEREGSAEYRQQILAIKSEAVANYYEELEAYIKDEEYTSQHPEDIKLQALQIYFELLEKCKKDEYAS